MTQLKKSNQKILLKFNISDLNRVISIEDVDLVNPAAGHEEALPWLQPGDTEPLDVLDGRGEAAQEW